MQRFPLLPEPAMNDPTPFVPLKGGCQCGRVTYSVSTPPVMAGLCYCTLCRKTSGAGHAFHAMVPEASLQMSGAPTWYSTTADSGNTVSSGFCGTCGSPLFGRSSGMPGMMTFRVANLDQPAAQTPQMAVFASRKLPWDHLDPQLPAFDTMPPMPG